MASLKNFEDLDIWKDAIHLAKDVYVLTQKDVFEQNTVLRDQLRQISVAISNHIADGFEYNSNHHFLKYLKMAKGDSGETRSMIALLHEIGYIELEEKEIISKQAQLLSNKIAGLIKFLDKPKSNTPSIPS